MSVLKEKRPVKATPKNDDTPPRMTDEEVRRWLEMMAKRSGGRSVVITTFPAANSD